MTEKKFQFAVNLPAMNEEEIGMRIMWRITAEDMQNYENVF